MGHLEHKLVSLGLSSLVVSIEEDSAGLVLLVVVVIGDIDETTLLGLAPHDQLIALVSSQSETG